VSFDPISCDVIVGPTPPEVIFPVLAAVLVVAAISVTVVLIKKRKK